MEIIESLPEPSEESKKTKYVTVNGNTPPRLEETFPTEEEKLDPASLSKEIIIFQYTKRLNSSQHPISIVVIMNVVYKEYEIAPATTAKAFLKLWRAGLVRRFFPIARDLAKARRKEGTYYLIHNMSYILPENHVKKMKRTSYYVRKKLSDEDVIKIRRLAQEYPLKDVAAMFPDISYTHIQRIVNYGRRRNVTPHK
jgi:hypothetical protein